MLVVSNKQLHEISVAKWNTLLDTIIVRLKSNNEINNSIYIREYIIKEMPHAQKLELVTMEEIVLYLRATLLFGTNFVSENSIAKSIFTDELLSKDAKIAWLQKWCFNKAIYV